MVSNIDEIIRENKKRLAVFEKERNPHTGLGSVLKRQEMFLDELDSPLYIPVDMLENNVIAQELYDAKSFGKFASKHGLSLFDAISIFSRARFEYDFEYWAITTTIIKHKETLDPIPFMLRIAQQVLLEALEEMRLAGVPIRIVLLKARQWGGSTLVQMYMFWIQQIHKKNWHLAVCAQDDGAAGNISELYKNASASYPPELATITYRPYARSPKNIVNKERGGIIGVGSINNPDQFRSYNYPMAHLSEVGVWQDTPKRTAKSLISSLRSTVPKVPYSLIVLESTAKGIGSFFHEEWMAAEQGNSGYKGVFVPWFMIDMYQMPIPNYAIFIKGMDDYAKFCWDQGATLEGINWYFNHKRDERYDDWQMYNEFPTTAEEAFISSGNKYFEPKILVTTKENIIAPMYTATVQPLRVSSKKELELTTFEKNPRGDLKIWKPPTSEVTIKGVKYYVANRYCGFGDIGGVHKDADFSCFTVLDRYRMLYGGWPELAAEWHGHVDQDLFAWICAQISWKYNKALLGIETNSLRTEKVNGDHFLTILDNIKDHYDNIYIRNQLDRTDKDWMPKYGFQTNTSSKDMILSALHSALRDDQYIEKDIEALAEFSYYERKADGTLGAISGKHDDRVMSRAGAYWLATSPLAMDPPKLIPIVEKTKKSKERDYTKPTSMGVI